MNTNRHQAGYTLIEVLVALTILAMSLSVLMRIFSAGLSSIGVSADYAHAVLLAESRLAAAAAGPFIPGETQGSDGDRFRWTTLVREYALEGRDDTEALPVEAFMITVVVEWPHGDGARHLDLSTLRLAAAD